MISTASVPTWAGPHVAPDQTETLRALRVMVAPAAVTELRALGVVTRDYRRPHTVSGYYDAGHLDLMARHAAQLAPQARGVYFTPNPINPALLGRACNRCRPLDDRDPTTADHDVLRRRYLLVDLDPKRPSEVSASEEEHAAALERAREVYRFLRAGGWPEPITADSGNGAHLVYPIDLPVNDGGLVQHVLEDLALRFDDDRVTVDTKNFNPARIWKLYGTLARKGESIVDRPHRLARITSVPGEVVR